MAAVCSVCFFVLSIPTWSLSACIFGILCNPLNLPDGVNLLGTCGFQPLEFCQVICKIDGTEIWKDFIRCLENGQWQTMPFCQPQIASTSLELVRCNRLPISVDEKTTCVKIKIAVPVSLPHSRTLCPEIFTLFVKFGRCRNPSTADCKLTCGNNTFHLLCLGNGKLSSECSPSKPILCPKLTFAELIACSRQPGTYCKIRCPNGRVTSQQAACLPSGEWSPLPSCNPRAQCGEESLPDEIRFLNSSCKTSQNINCKVGCLVHLYIPKLKSYPKKIVFIKEIRCGITGHWEKLPNCREAKKVFWDDRIHKTSCSTPNIDKSIILQGSCLYIEGSVCLFKCKQGFGPRGTHTLRCIKRKWLRNTQCKVLEKCPPLPKHLQFVRPCNRYARSTCVVKCKSGKLKGNAVILCSHLSNWKSLPTCQLMKSNGTSKCNSRKLASYLNFVSNCSFMEGEKCQIKCRNSLVLVGINFIRCHRGKWINIPQCFPQKSSPYNLLKIKCKFPPQLPANLKIIGKCNSNGGISCDVKCRDSSAHLTGPNATTCLPPGLWSKVTSCEGGQTYCSEPKLPKELKLIGECKGKQLGFKCYIHCKYRPKKIFTLICLKPQRWSRFPRCTCSKPILKEPLYLLHKCDIKIPGEICNLKCKKGYSIKGNSTIKCMNNLRWTILPTCKKITCPKPKLNSYLSFHEDCTTKLSDEYCHLLCKEGGNFVTHDKIKCIEGQYWTKLPNCTCSTPKLRKELLFKNDCTSVLPGEKCFLVCKPNSVLIGENFITCQKNTKWSVLPRCVKHICPKPFLPSSMIFIEDCSAKAPGEHCRIECRYGGDLLGPNKITCLSTAKWTSLPTCACPQPLLPDNLKTNGTCKRKIPGERCLLFCENNLKLKGHPFIICRNNTRWSLYPTCIKDYCIKKTLPKTLSYVDDCVAISPGGSCLVECKEGGKLHGSKSIKCIKLSKWTAMPNCSCPSPVLPADLKVKNSCDDVQILGKCYLECKTPHILIGKQYIICQNNTRWSVLPKCRKRICPKPKLTKILIYQEDCTSKFSGENCEISCREGGNLIGSNTITCLENKSQLVWSPLPKCSCPFPLLAADLRPTEDCSSKMPGEKCSLKCLDKMSLIGNNFIICQNHTKWNKLPKCKKNFCSKPRLPKELLFKEDCTIKLIGETCTLKCRSGGNLLYSNNIKCLNSTHWSLMPKCFCPLPRFPDYLRAIENCSLKQPGETCKVSCNNKSSTYPSDTIMCQNNFQWSALPKCKPKFCSKPKLKSTLLLGEKCTTKKIGDKCKVLCRMGGNVIGNNMIKCLTGNKWSDLPKCSCPLPHLKANLKVAENCNFKMPGDSCKLTCNEESTLIGKNFIICQNDTKWSTQPKCKKKICPKPSLPSYLVFKENCSSKTVMEKCELVCKHGGDIRGENFIECLSSLNWSEFPLCFCPKPHLNQELKFQKECQNKTAGEKCYLLCNNKRKMINKNYVQCMPDGKWTPLPKCIKKLCPEPKLQNSLLFKENCSYKTIGEKCQLKCKGSLKILGNPYIICQNNSKWNSLPYCSKNKCPKLVLPKGVLTFRERCINKSVGDICKVRCAQKGTLIGNYTIKCLSNSSWSSLPECTCLPPVLKNNLKGNCSYIKRGGKCLLACETGFELRGKKFLICRHNLKWTSQPKCIHSYCTRPELKGIFKENGTCLNKSVGATCKLECILGGKIIGKNYIKCEKGNYWSKLPDCTCPDPLLNDGLKVEENCSAKKSNETCRLTCKNSLQLQGENFITCMPNKKWSLLPNCSKKFCPDFDFSRTILKGQCNKVAVGSFCKVSCKEKGEIVGKDRIECLQGFTWSTLPDCTCGKPKFKKALVGNCTFVKRGQKCILNCKTGFTLKGRNYILCQNNTKWTSQPNCVPSFCPIPTLNMDILKLKENCSFMTVGATCKVECKDGRKIIGKDHIKCLNDLKWSRPPDCTCLTPNLTSNLEMKGNCSLKKINETCELVCKNSLKLRGSKFITCQSNNKWSIFPQCVQNFCPKPVFKGSILKMNETCSSKSVGETCKVTCNLGRKLIGKDHIKCLKGKKWSPLPDCSCLKPSLSPELKSKGSCSTKKRGDKCYLECKGELQIIGKSFIVCQRNHSWSSLPQCEKMFCELPKLEEEVVETIENCSKKVIGDTCRLICKQKGFFIRNDYITCLKGGHWSFTPKCTCPFPKLTPNLRTSEDCSSKKEGESCTLECKFDVKIKGDGEIFCQKNTTWTSLPECETKTESATAERHCPKLNIPDDVYNFLENCSSKRNGEFCKISCKQGGKILGRNEIQCLNGTKWSPLPNCTCPVPKLSHSLRTRGKCSEKNIGDKCHLFCKRNMRLSGKTHITCQNNTKWSSYPKCINETSIKCTTPDLPINLQFKENCSNKATGELCSLKCKHGGSIVGNETIKCLNDQKWSSLPKCTCPSPSIPSDLEISENCTFKKVGDKCILNCKNNKKLSGDNEITCLRNFTWSSLPNCESENEAFPQRKMHCPEPKIPNDILDLLENCSLKTVGEFCKVSCKHTGKILGDNKIKCLNNTKWSPLPNCTCPIPLLPNELTTSEKCSEKKIGEMCELICRGSLKLVGNKHIVCKNNTEWSGNPKCVNVTCPPPVLPIYLSIKEDCFNKSVGESCTLYCKHNMKLLGKNIITCLDNITWTSLPYCEPQDDVTSTPEMFCPDPDLRGILNLLEDCSLKRNGEVCELSCKEGGKILGQNEIKCLNGTWSNSPSCTCAAPLLSKNLTPIGNCTEKRIGEKCQLHCKENFKLIGKKYIKCKSNTKWTSNPKCVNETIFQCPLPELPSNLELMENCLNKAIGESCNLKCKHGGIIIGSPELKCLKEKKWSTLPNCSCPQPTLPDNFETKENCSFKKIGEECELSCSLEGYGVKISGEYAIICQNDNSWSVLPECEAKFIEIPEIPLDTSYCPEPDKRGGILNFKEDCSRKQNGEFCEISCTQGGKILGNAKIECLNGKSWDSLPDCSCPEPLLPSHLESIENCTEKKVGEFCKLSCKLRGKNLGENKIKCLNSTKWSPLPNCTCPIPILSNDLTTSENCSEKKIEETCELICKGKLKLTGNKRIICKNNSEWSEIPKCVNITCPLPVLPIYLELKGKCFNKSVGEFCNLSCKQGGVIIGEETIKCQNDKTWSSLPNCLCPNPILSPDLEINGTCTSKTIGDSCMLNCKNNMKMLGKNVITCLNNMTWTSLPYCEPNDNVTSKPEMFCPNPDLAGILNLLENCSLKENGEVCKLSCKEGGKILGKNEIKCLNGTWSDSPRCTCPTPLLSQNLTPIGNCTEKRIGGKCQLRCKENFKLIGKKYIKCKSNTKWTSNPKCVNEAIFKCPIPELSSNLELIENCLNKAIGESCNLKCKHGGIIIGNPELKCLKEKKWSPLPNCSCPQPTLPDNFETKENCSFKEIGDKCELSCSLEGHGVKISGEYTIICQNDSNWSVVPECEAKFIEIPEIVTSYCPEPDTRGGILNFKENCSRKENGEFCEISCKQGGKILGNDKIECHNGKTWSSLPDCTCPPPVLSTHLETLENCTEKKRGEKCKLKCVGNLILNGRNYLKCKNSTKWTSKPTCLEPSRAKCPKPRISNQVLKFAENCSAKSVGETCNLTCRQRGKIIGNHSIVCMHNKTWSSRPDCTCPTPNLPPSSLEFKDNCTYKKRGDECKLRCKGNSKMIGNDTIMCQSNTKWTKLPKCEKSGNISSDRKTTCLKPMSFGGFLRRKDCSGYSVGQRCKLECKHGGKFTGPDYIECLRNRTWTRLPDCTCPPPKLSGNLETQEDCSNKRKGETCKLLCKEGLSMIGQDSMVCGDFRKWIKIPTCKLIS